MSFDIFDRADRYTGMGQSANAINADPGFQAQQEQFRRTVLNPPQTVQSVVVEENIKSFKANPDDIRTGALAGGGNQAISLQPLGLRGYGGLGQSTILGA